MKALRVLFLAAALAPCLGLAEQKTKPLNFVFFLVDDLGWVGLKYFVNSFYCTPKCNRLATMGMKFTNAYTEGPVGAPRV